ncbi:unnamed protein product [Protopolystoma xenopodis]|uniref:Transmembrane protein 188 n=1 Tax=Protopolystoma xenopodis TaxID=117903 RepID=A0A448X8P5_9PLAT|nr:unnamed protein product [Protopolystoma xenopodis]
MINSEPPEPTEDLKAFERRLREIMDGLQPKARFWRLLLVLAISTSCLTAYLWLIDPATYEVNFFRSLRNHPEFIISLFALSLLFVSGAHKKVVLSRIIAERSRLVLAEYNMTCDYSGKLILRPRPTP